MYDEFNEYISSEFSHDYWHDEGIDIALDMLYKFKETDWVRLSNDLPMKNTYWKVKLANCLGDVDNPYARDLLILMVEKNNGELLEASIDSLRNKDLSNMTPSEKDKILIKINTIIPQCDNISKGILLDFKGKIQ